MTGLVKPVAAAGYSSVVLDIVALVLAAWNLCDGTANENPPEVDQQDWDRLSAALDKLDLLPPVPGVISGPGARVEHFLLNTTLSHLQAAEAEAEMGCDPDGCKAHIEAFSARAEAAEAEVSKLKAQVEWQPIETAPRDGRAILIAAYGAVHIVRWAHSMRSRRSARSFPWLADEGGNAWRDDVPTHWRPLPAPPSQARALSDEVNDGQ